MKTKDLIFLVIIFEIIILTDEDMYEYSDKRCDFFERK